MKMITYRMHALKRMAEKDITNDEVEETIESGEIIETYPDDKPYPSFLAFKIINKRAIHVVFAEAPQNDGGMIVITTYSPDLIKWMPHFRTRRTKK